MESYGQSLSISSRLLYLFPDVIVCLDGHSVMCNRSPMAPIDGRGTLWQGGGWRLVWREGDPGEITRCVCVCVCVCVRVCSLVV